MPKILLRRGTDAERLGIILSEGEPYRTTDTKLLYVGDGTTAGGILVGDANHDHDDLYAKGPTEALDVDPDTLKDNGVFHVNPHVNSPTTAHYSYTVYGNESDVVAQLATEYLSGATYVRSYHTAWNAWRLLYSDSYHPNADKWTTARTITLAGDASGSVSIDGSSNVVLNTSVQAPWSSIVGKPPLLSLDLEGSSTYSRIVASDDPSNGKHWLRVGTSSGHGLLPYANGVGNLGTTNWKFDNAHVTSLYGDTVYEGGVKLSDKYYHAGNDGSGSGLDAELFNGVAESKFGRLDLARTWTADQTFTRDVCVQGITLHEASNGHYVRWDNRDDGAGDSRLHFYNLTSANTALPLKMAWYDGSGYMNVTMSSNKNVNFEGGTITANTFKGSLTGNATSASKWSTARTLTFNGDVSGYASIDGTENKTISLAVSDNSHNHSYSVGDFIVGNNSNGHLYARHINGKNWSDNSDDHLYLNKQNGKNVYINGARAFADNYHPNADRWTTARALTLSGDVTGSVSIDGSSNVTLTATVANNSHTHTSANISDATNANTANKIVKRDASGNFSAGTITATLSGIATYATKLANINTSFSGTHPMVVNVSGVLYSHTTVTYDGTSKTITAPNFAGALSGNATTATTLATARTINGTSFNGSASITTARWGTSRNITIGSTTKAVNGSANVSWSLGEIGAAAASHTHNYAASSSAGGPASRVLVATSSTSSWYNVLWQGASGDKLHRSSSTFQATGTGHLRCAGNITAYYSDRRLKNVHEHLSPEEALRAVCRWKKVRYTANTTANRLAGYDMNKTEIGLLADEIEQDYPELVPPAPFDLDEDNKSKSGANYKTLDYERIVAVQAAAIEALSNKLENVLAEVKQLKEKVH